MAIFSHARTLALVALTASCSQAHEQADTVSCPTLFDGTWSSAGVVGLPSSRAGGCAQAWLRNVLVAQSPVGSDGAFALSFTAVGDLRDAIVDVDIGGDRQQVQLGGDPEALIDYEPDSLPLVDRGDGYIEFDGWLASTDESTPIETVWMVNWSWPTAAETDHPVELEVPFTAPVRGMAGDTGGPVSRHASGGAGGCWWPGGGGGWARCSDHAVRSGLCPLAGSESECVEGRGCEPTTFPERRSGAPRRELPHDVPVLDGRPRPPDGGMSDGGPA